MSKLRLTISMSLDGFVAGRDQTLEQPLGAGGEALHEWAVGTRAFRELHGREGGEDSVDSEVIEEHSSRLGATIMGRRMFSGGEGPWEDDPNANGWWGEDPPFGAPVFVVTHHQREPLVLGSTTFTFVDGIDDAIRQAREASGGRDVQVSGGASVAQQALNAGLLDELRIHVAPLILGGGVRLFDQAERRPIELTDVVGSPRVTHLTYAVS